MTAPHHGVACIATAESTYDPIVSLDIGHGRIVEGRAIPVRELGRGRAARAILYRVELGNRTLDVVEKHFTPATLTRALYRLFFTAPFAYANNHDAALACLYRRRVARGVLALLDPDAHWLADALYVRQCAAGHYVLGTELIDGRPLAPTAVAPELGATDDELPSLLGRMKLMEAAFLDAGLLGSGWQVSTATIVATANFIHDRRDGQPVCIDIESGMPALVAPRYLWLSLTGHPLPLFDDVDTGRLNAWLEHNDSALRTRLSDRFDEFEQSVLALKEHTRLWKRTEPALGRHGFALMRDSTLRQSIRRSMLDRWSSQDRLDQEAYARLGRSDRLWSQPLILLGALPTAVGRQIHRMVGNRHFRRHVLALIRDRPRRDEWFFCYQRELFTRLRLEGRLRAATDTDDGGRQYVLAALRRIVLHRFLAAVATPRAHRLLSDWTYAAASLRLALLALCSEQVQEQLARVFLDTATRRWQGMGRLDEQGRRLLVAELHDGEASDYLRGFGTHLALKLFGPVTTGLKLAGVAILAVTPWSLLGLALLLNTSFLRTLLTTGRWWRGRRHGSSYAIAFMVGALPVGGTLAFPMQLHHGRPELSRFLLRWIPSQLAASVPIFGGTSTRLEVFAVGVGSWLSRAITRTTRIFPVRVIRTSRASARVPPSDWWSRQVDAALGWLQEEQESRRTEAGVAAAEAVGNERGLPVG